MEPGKVYGYSGPVCHCQPMPKYQQPTMSQQVYINPSPYIQEIMNRLKAIEDKLK